MSVGLACLSRDFDLGTRQMYLSFPLSGGHFEGSWHFGVDPDGFTLLD